MKKKYITSAIPYVNASPHIGHALEFVQTDALVRYYKLQGFDTLYLCGSDENALKNLQAAEKEGISVQKLVDKNTVLFQKLATELNVRFDVFQKGSDKKKHFVSSQKFWQLCWDNGDIYKKNYEGLYCVGCEMFYTPDELDDNGECFEHPGKKLEKVSETNYFFRLSKYQKELTDWITKNTIKIVPQTRKNEVLSFLKQPLQDISISRSNERAKNWGVPVPNDPDQRMYVWFDALNIYQSGIGFGLDEDKYEKWWPADIHVIGKGIIRFHAIYWPAFLYSAGLKLPKSIFVHGYITVEGQKMSKTIGNVIDPFALIKKYGADAVRYYLLREIPSIGDGDYSEHRMQEVYNADLANELGNLVSRVTNLAEKEGLVISKSDQKILLTAKNDIGNAVENFELNRAIEYIWLWVKGLNKKLDQEAPWKKSSLGRKIIVQEMINELNNVGQQLSLFLPETAEKIMQATQGKIRKAESLFPKR